MEDYLEAIYIISKTRGYARTSEIAKNLQVSPSSVVEMVSKIAKMNLAEWKRYEGVYLTPQGRIHGEVVHIRHETLRRFFEFIGVNPEVADREACIIEHELSPVTTSAIGNLVQFLETSAGSQTREALKMFLKFLNAGITWDGPAMTGIMPSSEEMQNTVKKSDHHYQILSALTRHDLQNSLAALYGYLDILRETDIRPETNEIITRIENVTISMHRQIAESSDLLIPGKSARVWINLGGLIDAAIDELSSYHVHITHNLHAIELYSDPLLGRVVYNLLENATRHGESVHSIECGFSINESDLIWYIQDDGCGVSEGEKQIIFRPRRGSNSGLGLCMVDQILTSCGMRIDEQGIPGQGARFIIKVPLPLYRNVVSSQDSNSVTSKPERDETTIC